MNVFDVEQGSAEWAQLRLGRVTASRIADVVARTKSGYGASRGNYMAQLIAERLTGQAQESYINAAMQHGLDTEAEARAAYEFRRNLDVTQVGFVGHPTIDMAGCSPDGLVGEHGLVEVKCPNTGTHLDTLIGQTIPDKYQKQALWQMACTGRQWVDFVSYDPRLPEAMRLWVSRIERDRAAIAELEQAVRDFLAELDDKLTRLRSLYDIGDAA